MADNTTYTPNPAETAAQQPQPQYPPQYPQQPQTQYGYSQQYYPQGYYPQYQPAPVPGRSKGTASLVMGICSICLCGTLVLTPITAPLGLAGGILGFLAYREAKKGSAPTGLGIAGLITSFVGMVLSVAILVFGIWALKGLVDMAEQYNAHEMRTSNNPAYNANSNSAANANEDEDDAITNITGATAAVASWKDFAFDLDGCKVQLGKTKLSEVMEETSWDAYMDPAASDLDIPQGKETIEIALVRSDMPRQGQIIFTLANKGSAEKAGDLVIQKVMVDGINLDDNAEIHATFPGAARIGSSEQAVTRLLKEPDQTEGPAYNRKCTWGGDDDAGSLEIEFSTTGAYRICYGLQEMSD